MLSDLCVFVKWLFTATLRYGRDELDVLRLSRCMPAVRLDSALFEKMLVEVELVRLDSVEKLLVEVKNGTDTTRTRHGTLRQFPTRHGHVTKFF